MSKSQESLEQASKAVGVACRALVKQVRDMIKDRDEDEEKNEKGSVHTRAGCTISRTRRSHSGRSRSERAEPE